MSLLPRVCNVTSRLLLTAGLSLALAGAARAQTPRPPVPGASTASQLVRYRAGKSQLDQGHYEAALRELEPLAQPTARFERGADAAYLAAVAAARLKQWAEAEQLLNLLRTEYPTYPNFRDALLLQGQVSFEQADYDTALKTLALLPPGPLGPEREAAKAYYLPRLTDRATWQRLLRRYPDDATLARAWAERLGPGGQFTEADRGQLEALIAKFGLDRARYAPRARAAQRKSTYNVALLLPFELDDPSWQTQRRNQFVTDLYAGLRLAQDSLQRAGHPLQVFAYDTGADTLRLAQVLALPELAGMDLIIGPVYKSGAKLLARYAQRQQIVCVNPLSQDLDLVIDNPWYYLFSPSAATQGRVAARFAAANLGTTKPALLLHDDSKDNVDFARAYQQTFEGLGGKVTPPRPFDPDNDASLNAAFSGLDLAGAGHVVVASDSRRTGPVALRTLATALTPPPVSTRVPAAPRPALLCPGTWLENQALDVNQLGSLNAYFVQPKYYDEAGYGFRRFRQLYLLRQHLPPSIYASQGFEMLLFFGNALSQFGSDCRAGISAAGAVPGAIFEPISYDGGAHDNQVVPITRLTNLELQVVR